MESDTGHFGTYGGRYVPEMLVPALEQLTNAYDAVSGTESFNKELLSLQQTFTGRPTPLLFAERLTKQLGGCQIYLKLESMLHTGAHKINNTIGQALLAMRMGKRHLVAETGAGQHGLATATVAAKFGLRCTVFMGETDMKRQYPNVFYMRLLGAEVVPVLEGSKTLKDAVNAALKFWIENLGQTHYLIGSALGPSPYPRIVRDFQSVIGKEVARQLMDVAGRKPDALVACVGGGSNSMGLFHNFINDPDVKLYGVEAGGYGVNNGEHARRLSLNARVGIAQGYKSYFIRDEDGNLESTHSISAGLDYPGVGPELAQLHDCGRINFSAATDEEAIEAVKLLSASEGIIPALESSHAVAFVKKLAPGLGPDKIIVVSISGRGDKDLFITARKIMGQEWIDFLSQEVSRG